MYGSSGNKLQEKSKIAARVRIKPAADGADALCDTEILHPILHPVILWDSARAKSLWMGFNLSLFFFLSLRSDEKGVRGVTTVGGAEGHLAKQTQTWYQISGF